MNTKRTPARIVEENDLNEEVPHRVEQVEKVPQLSQVPQGYKCDQVPIKCGGNYVPVVPPEITNVEIREALLAIYRALSTHVIMGIEPRVKVVEITMTSRLRDFVRMNSPIFLSSNVGEDS